MNHSSLLRPICRCLLKQSSRRTQPVPTFVFSNHTSSLATDLISISNTSRTYTTSTDELLYTPPNPIRPPSKHTSNAYLHRIHSLLYPPPPSELSAFAHRIPKLPIDTLSRHDLLSSIEQCLVSPSFWKAIEEGDVKLDDLKKAVSAWNVIQPTTSDFEGDEESGLFLPGKLTSVVAPDQSMDASPHMHPHGTQRRKTLTQEQKIHDPNLALLQLDPNWKDNYPKFTNYLDDGQLHNEQFATLGNSLLGLLGAEWIDCRYPHLPNKSVNF